MFMKVPVRSPGLPKSLPLVLGPTLENEFRTAMMLSVGDPAIFYTSPTVLIFFSLALLVIGLQAVSEFKAKKQPKNEVKADA